MKYIVPASIISLIIYLIPNYKVGQCYVDHLGWNHKIIKIQKYGLEYQPLRSLFDRKVTFYRTYLSFYADYSRADCPTD